MCLEHITRSFSQEEQKENKRVIYGGYKIFRKDSSSNLFSFLHKSKKMKINAWLDEREFRPASGKNAERIGTWGRHYPNGWHVFTDANEAERLLRANKSVGKGNVVLREVKYKMVHTLGTEKGDPQHQVHIAVCSQIMVMPLPKKTTPIGKLKIAAKKTASKGKIKTAKTVKTIKKAVKAKRGGRDAKSKSKH
jgi:hypothetical protein